MVYHLVLLSSPPLPSQCPSMGGGVKQQWADLYSQHLYSHTTSNSSMLSSSQAGSGGSGWRGRGEAAQADGRLPQRWAPQLTGFTVLAPPQLASPHSFSSPLFFQLLPLSCVNYFSVHLPSAPNGGSSYPFPFPYLQEPLLNKPNPPRHHHRQSRTLFFLHATELCLYFTFPSLLGQESRQAVFSQDSPPLLLRWVGVRELSGPGSPP